MRQSMAIGHEQNVAETLRGDESGAGGIAEARELQQSGGVEAGDFVRAGQEGEILETQSGSDVTRIFASDACAFGITGGVLRYGRYRSRQEEPVIATAGETGLADTGENDCGHAGRKVAVPLVTVNVIENVFTGTQKRERIEKVTGALVAIEGEAMRGIAWVPINEVSECHRGIGGRSPIDSV